MSENNTQASTATVQENKMKIDEKVIKKMIASALVEVDGYLGTANGLIGGITGMFKKNETEEAEALSGIGVSVKDNAVAVTLKVIVEAGKNIPTITNAITENVQAKLQEIGGFETKDVSIDVVDMMTKAEYEKGSVKVSTDKKEETAK